ncbi:PPOX class F420-dependent oxidoreductase [Streptomyces johnsoniae]|uniref:PPOX class F420-dependent oxidoreductase n=1 Tax=Streptomyces johnsoniae TaxID=3075532 RepID=A0ABU2SDH5_9ACTN|nr:PPOX class F420-dependent oxidoreductase [Streptomyces sp. DSM 41886]MDT0447027.1 PPOX class F420-dependent oxidoreductase [Streptomyces sp. DSM 41886]
MTTAFDDTTRALLDGTNVATLATLNPDGSPQTSVVWVMSDEGTVLLSTTAARQKAKNIARDPRVALTVFDAANPYLSRDIRGTAELTGDPDKLLGRRLSHKYLGQDPPLEPDDVVRLVVRITPTRVLGFAG